MKLWLTSKMATPRLWGNAYEHLGSLKNDGLCSDSFTRSCCASSAMFNKSGRYVRWNLSPCTLRHMSRSRTTSPTFRQLSTIPSMSRSLYSSPRNVAAGLATGKLYRVQIRQRIARDLVHPEPCSFRFVSTRPPARTHGGPDRIREGAKIENCD